ncbi:hypothetical protein LCGC14_0243790 [marine sediment metagenome]|uniref:Uncharacterized protein n=1 Tax=marine sediment metagenome TaxID=412755 RepID=A0A0F9UMS5_9ZZZZ
MESVKQTIKFLEAGIKTLGMTSTIEVEQKSDTEFLVNLPGLGINLLIETDGTLRFGMGGREVRGPKWQVFTVVPFHATFDDPESTDEVHRGDYDILGDAVSRVFELSVRDIILNMIESSAVADDLAEDARIAVPKMPSDALVEVW